MKLKKYNSFKKFYPFYQSQHQNSICRLLHLIGTSLILYLVIFYIRDFKNFIFIPLIGYGFAWIGHFFFEKNNPATFKHPVYSLLGDLLMFWNIITGKEKI